MNDFTNFFIKSKTSSVFQKDLFRASQEDPDSFGFLLTDSRKFDPSVIKGDDDVSLTQKTESIQNIESELERIRELEAIDEESRTSDQDNELDALKKGETTGKTTLTKLKKSVTKLKGKQSKLKSIEQAKRVVPEKKKKKKKSIN